MTGKHQKLAERITGRKSHYVPTLVLLTIICLATIFGIIFYQRKKSEYTDLLAEKEYEIYEYYFVMIVEDPESSFWENVYDSALARAKEQNAYLEMPGKELEMRYSKQEQMEIAIEAGVDGIILEADNSDSTAKLIDEAVNRNIPVITVLEDSKNSKRQSFVGISNYHIGREYGRVVASSFGDDSQNIMVFMDEHEDANVQSMLVTGIQEGMADSSSDITIHPINEDGAFAAEELIRDIFMEEEKLPDVIICMDEVTTTCVYQMVVDYNKVGNINIIGYYDSDTILKAIERSVISATITINSAQMGEYCLNALTEYIQTGHVSDYFSSDIDVIDADNLETYREKENEEGMIQP